MDLSSRRAVWQCLSELFLDTELSEGDFARLADELRQSGCSLPEIESILKCEVAPVLGGNLLVTAGVWEGLSVEQIEGRYLAGRGRSTLTGCLTLRLIRSDWARVKATFNAP